MGWTVHGHHIEGSPYADPKLKPDTVNCGWPIMPCIHCEAGAKLVASALPPQADTNPPTHKLYLEVLVGSQRSWDAVWGEFSRWQSQMGTRFPAVNVLSYLINENDPGVEESSEYYDENTLEKVREAISTVLSDEALVMELITKMSQSGILFRERR